jgi:hypothetical protein
VVRWLAITDTLLPGSGLIIEGRTWPGAALLAPAIVALSLLLICLLLGGAFAAWATLRVLPAYALLSITTLCLRWRYERRARLDPTQVKLLARTAAQAWLRGQDDVAASTAKALVQAAPELPNAWRLNALVTGDPRATRRAEAIERRQ